MLVVATEVMVVLCDGIVVCDDERGFCVVLVLELLDPQPARIEAKPNCHCRHNACVHFLEVTPSGIRMPSLFHGVGRCHPDLAGLHAQGTVWPSSPRGALANRADPGRCPSSARCRLLPRANRNAKSATNHERGPIPRHGTLHAHVWRSLCNLDVTQAVTSRILAVPSPHTAGVDEPEGSWPTDRVESGAETLDVRPEPQRPAHFGRRATGAKACSHRHWVPGAVAAIERVHSGDALTLCTIVLSLQPPSRCGLTGVECDRRGLVAGRDLVRLAVQLHGGGQLHRRWRRSDDDRRRRDVDQPLCRPKAGCSQPSRAPRRPTVRRWRTPQEEASLS